jgi:hypothetical protein
MADIRQFPARQFIEVSADEWLEAHSEVARCLKIVVTSLELAGQMYGTPGFLNQEIIRRSKAALEKVGA